MKKQLWIITLAVLAGSMLCASAAPGSGSSDRGANRGGRDRDERNTQTQRMLQRFDEDGDGKLSADEKAAAKEAMEARKARADLDGDGKVSEDERKAAREEMMKRIDTNGDGKISDEERKAADAAKKNRGKK